jgi:hypothetical protein
MDPLIREIRVIGVHWFSYIFRAFHARRVPKRRERGPVDAIAAIAVPSPIRFNHRKAVQYDGHPHSYHSAPAASVIGRNRSEAGDRPFGALRNACAPQPPMEEDMPSTRLTLVPVALLALACSSEPSAPPTLPRASAPSLNNGSGVEVMVSGAGVVNFVPGGSSLAPFEFVAWRQADGTAGGHFRQYRFGALGTVDFEGVVTCVTTDPAFPERARIAGIITMNRSTDTRFLTVNHEVGDDVWFRVESIKSGADAGDKSTTYGFKPTLVNTSAEYCALPFTGLLNGQNVWNPGSLFALSEGQITIHDKQ